MELPDETIGVHHDIPIVERARIFSCTFPRCPARALATTRTCGTRFLSGELLASEEVHVNHVRRTRSRMENFFAGMEGKKIFYLKILNNKIFFSTI